MPSRPLLPPRTLRAGLLGLAAGLLPALAPQRADALLVFKMRQVGSDVVVSGGGKFVTTGLKIKDAIVPPEVPRPAVQANAGFLQITNSMKTLYVWEPEAQDGLIGDSFFGTGGFEDQGVQTQGAAVAGIDIENQEVFLPIGAACTDTSNQCSTISDSITLFPALSFASLGVTPGSYFWSWGPEENQKFQLEIEAPAPVPGPLPALAGAAAFGWSRRLRRRVSPGRRVRRAYGAHSAATPCPPRKSCAVTTARN